MGNWPRGQHAADLIVELVPGKRAVIVRDEQEDPLQQVLPQARQLDLAEARRARILHEDERTLEERLVGEADDDGVRHFFLAIVRHPDAHLGQFGEPDTEVDVGARIVRAPALLLAAVAGEHDAAEVEAAVERGGLSESRPAAGCPPCPRVTPFADLVLPSLGDYRPTFCVSPIAFLPLLSSLAMALVFHNAALAALRVDGTDRADQVESIAVALQEHGVLAVTPLTTGLYPASSATDLGASGYGRVWVRDNVYVALALLESGRPQAAAAVAKALMAFYSKHRHRLLASPSDATPRGLANRPHVRFDGESLEEIGGEVWPHAQNDALGYCLWLCARLARRQVIELGAGDLDTLALLANYLGKLPYWDDEDSGHWEETRKRSASSIGVVVAGLQEWAELLEEQSDDTVAGTSRTAVIDVAIDAAGAGLEALAGILPAECTQPSPLQHRRYDAALLCLLYPLDVVRGEMADRILSDVRQHLQGEIGIRRYPGDSVLGARLRLAPLGSGSHARLQRGHREPEPSIGAARRRGAVVPLRSVDIGLPWQAIPGHGRAGGSGRAGALLQPLDRADYAGLALPGALLQAARYVRRQPARAAAVDAGQPPAGADRPAGDGRSSAVIHTPITSWASSSSQC